MRSCDFCDQILETASDAYLHMAQHVRDANRHISELERQHERDQKALEAITALHEYALKDKPDDAL
jgi:predicted  nucleic acid-binding Zn-ribbon protein